VRVKKNTSARYYSMSACDDRDLCAALPDDLDRSAWSDNRVR